MATVLKAALLVCIVTSEPPHRDLAKCPNLKCRLDAAERSIFYRYIYERYATALSPTDLRNEIVKHYPKSKITLQGVSEGLAKTFAAVTIPKELANFLKSHSGNDAAALDSIPSRYRAEGDEEDWMARLDVWRHYSPLGVEDNEKLKGYQTLKLDGILNHLWCMWKRYEEQVQNAVKRQRPFGDDMTPSKHAKVTTTSTEPVQAIGDADPEYPIPANVLPPVMADAPATMTEEVSIPERLVPVYTGPLRMEVLSIIRGMISLFSNPANPVNYPDKNFLHATEAHIRANFPSSEMSQSGISSVVRKILSYTVLPNEIVPLIGHTLGEDKLIRVAVAWKKPFEFVSGCLTIWALFRNQGYEPHSSIAGSQTFSRPGLLSYLRCTLKNMQGPVNSFKDEIPIVMRVLITHPGASSSDVVSFFKKERPMSLVTLADVVRISRRLDQLAVELMEEYETAQILDGLTQEGKAEIINSFAQESLFPMAHTVYSILLIQCLFSHLEATVPKSRREGQPDQPPEPVGDADLAYPIRANIPSEEVSIPAHLLPGYTGRFRNEVLSIIRYLISIFSNSLNPVVYPDMSVLYGTEAHIRTSFPTSGMPGTAVSSVVRKLLSHILIPNEVVPLIGRSVRREQLAAFATKWDQSAIFVIRCISVWTEFHGQGFEPHPSLAGFQIFTRSTLLSYLRSTLRDLEEGDKADVDNMIPFVMRLLMIHPGASSSALLSLIQKERPMSVITLTDVVRISTRLDELAVELTKEYETAQVLTGFTQQGKGKILASFAKASL